jgi:hypothetical protein
MEEILQQRECFRDREESIRRLPQLVFAAFEACRRRGGDLQLSKAAFPKAIGAKCNLCGFVLSGEELLALADVFGANEESTMLKRLRAGHCAREGCAATHYHLLFYNTPELSWPAILAKSRPTEAENPQPESEPVIATAPARRNILPKVARVGAVIGICLLLWLWWQWRTGGRIPILREPEHFRVTPSNVDPPTR